MGEELNGFQSIWSVSVSGRHQMLCPEYYLIYLWLKGKNVNHSQEISTVRK